MTDAPSVRIRRARRDEAEPIAEIIRLGFATVAEKFGDIPPLHERAADIEATFDRGDVTIVAEISTEGGPRLVGTVRGETLQDGSIMIRRLAVLPEVRRQGLARALMAELETAYPHASRFELFTGADAVEPLALYESLGYSRIDRRDDDYPFLVYLEKRVR